MALAVRSLCYMSTNAVYDKGTSSVCPQRLGGVCTGWASRIFCCGFEMQNECPTAPPDERELRG